MSKFPHTAEQVNSTVRVNVDAQLDRLGQSMEWLAGEVGVSTHRLLAAITDGSPVALLWDASEALGIPTASLVKGLA